MKRIFLSIILFLFVLCIGSNTCAWAQEAPELRDYSGIELSAGTFVPVITTQEISTAYCDEGLRLKFITTSDLYLCETNVIPKDSEFSGYIEKINEPVIGTNASMTIRLNKLTLPDGFEIPLYGYIYSSNKNIIGGELTSPAFYDKKPHYQQGFVGTMQYVPSGERKMGEHTVITAGADLVVVLTKPIRITHTLTN